MLKSKLGFVAPSVAVRCARAHGVDWTSHAQRVSPLVPSVVLFLDAARVGLQVGHSTVHEEGEGAEEFPQFADRPLAVRGRGVRVVALAYMLVGLLGAAHYCVDIVVYYYL